VAVLIVTDSGGSFGTSAFGLKALVDALSVPPGPWVRFAITRANRRVDPTADIQNFSFAATDLSQWDEIWLFGVERTNGLALTQQDLRAISQFMDNGGGVFATGDHEDLGVAMCGSILRVRSMRKWHWPNPGPNGEPPAPPVDGLDRLDTLRAGGSAGFQFDDQSDDLPQTISPRMYTSWTHPWHLGWQIRPHPVLCGPRGTIRVLPDHPHEGECYVPADLTASLTFDGYTTAEYPTFASGGHLAPEVIATSSIIGGRSAMDVKGAVTPRSFGAIGAWDGHRVSRGRVLVDATWHHFFNINLVGDAGSPDPLKRIGFAASPAGLAAYEDIKAYYRNIAVWIARPECHRCMRWRALWTARWDNRLVMDLRPAYLDNGLPSLDLAELLRIGEVARDVLGRIASQCQAELWLIDIGKVLLPKQWPHLDPFVDPWWPLPPDPPPDPVPWLYANRLVDALLGGAIYALGAEFPVPDRESAKKAEKLNWERVLRPAALVAVKRVREAATQSKRDLDQLGRALAPRAPRASGQDTSS
jgi:hypothetical protein